MAIPSDITTLKKKVYIESTTTSGQPALAIVNPDGSNIGSIPGTGATNLGKAEDAAHSSGDTGVAILGVYKATPTQLSGADGDYSVVLTDANGGVYVTLATLISGEDQTNTLIGVQNKPVAVSTYAWSSDQSSALEASSVSKASPGVLRRFFGFIDSSAATDIYYVQIYNASSVPSDGAVTHLVAPIVVNHTNGTDTKFELTDLGSNGVYASTGICWAVSTTAVTKTVASSVAFATLLYK